MTSDELHPSITMIKSCHRNPDTREATLGKGEWLSEPDFELMLVKSHGEEFIAYINRNFHTGNLCGYVLAKLAVPESFVDLLSPHGGVTMHTQADYWVTDIEELREAILNHPDYDLSTATVIGFDTSHAGDLMPAMDRIMDNIRREGITGYPNVYRNIKFMRSQILDLCHSICYLNTNLGIFKW